MTRLPLYPEGAPGVYLEHTPGLARDPACARCHLGAGATNRCITDEGRAGGLMVIGESPGREEDRAGRPFVGVTGAYLRGLLARMWAGPVVLSNAVRCYPPPDAKKNSASKIVKAIGECRPYLARTLEEAKPTRIVAMGAWAAQSVLGVALPPTTSRRAYAWTREGVPVFFLLHPTAGLRNRFYRKWFEEDLAWALAEQPGTPPQWDATWSFVRQSNVREACEQLRAAEWMAYDVETSGARYDACFTLLEVGCVGKGAKHVWVWDTVALADPICRAGLVRLLEDPRVGKVGSNIQVDIGAVHASLGANVANVHMDARLARKALDSEASGRLADMATLVGLGGHKGEMETHKLASRAAIRLAARTGDTTWLEQWGHPRALVARAVVDSEYMEKADELDRYSYAFAPPVIRARYNARDALTTARVTELMERRLATHPRPGVPRIHDRLIRPAVNVFARMESAGFAADTDAMQVWIDALRAAVEPHNEVLARKAPDVNWRSHVQVSEHLYGKLGLHKSEFAKSSSATDKKSLAKLSGKNAVVDALINKRKLDTLISTFALPMPRHVRDDGRLHTNYLLDGTGTGRPSSHDPNLLNMPAPSRDPEGGPYWGRMARDCFVSMTPPERARLRGVSRKVLLNLDMSQIELRVMARRSGDKVMIQVFRDKEDLHQKTAEFIAPIVWGIPKERVEKRHRQAAKTTNFGLAYGQGDAQLAETITAAIGAYCSKAEATAIREAVLGTFVGLRADMERTKAQAKRDGYAYTLFEGQPARERWLPRIADHDEEKRGHAERAAYNTGIQGEAADYCLASIIALDDWIQCTGVPARIVCTVYDSITIECELSCVDEVYAVAKQIMESWDLGDVPIIADGEVGWAWGSLDEIDTEKGKWPSAMCA